jgi:hypothetical protein
MASTISKRKYLIQTIELNSLERFRQFEIKLPANVKKVTGIIISTRMKGE